MSSRWISKKYQKFIKIGIWKIYLKLWFYHEKFWIKRRKYGRVINSNPWVSINRRAWRDWRLLKTLLIK